MLRIIKKLIAILSPVYGLVSLIVLAVTLSAPASGSQDAGNDVDPHPLRPADTSSPRDTLRSFLTNMIEAIQARRQADDEMITTTGLQAYSRALQTLDFSTTPYSDSWMVRTQRVAMLKELLDRIELPPDNEIPGKTEVAEGAITQWTIPNTRIRIKRIEQGPRAGEFLFSADTVEGLERLYRHAKHLPYQPGTAAVGWYENYLRSDRTAMAFERQLLYRLKPVDTSNPRSTLEGFLDSINRAYVLVMEAEAALKETPPKLSKKALREIEIKAENLLQRAVATLDLSEVPETLRKDFQLETALQLIEILDRTLLPPIDSVPDAQMVAALREQASKSALKSTGPLTWRYPNTEIEIVEITEGERQGQFLFSARTVRRISDFYEEIRDLPYRPVEIDKFTHDYLSPGKSKGFYEYYISTPGYLIPHANSLGRLFDRLPDGLKTIHDGQTLWQWIGLLLCVLAVALVSYLLFRLTRGIAARLPNLLDDLLRTLAPVLVALIVIAVTDFIDNDLNITGDPLAVVKAVSQIIVLVMAAWAVFLFCKGVAETIIHFSSTRVESFDASLWRIAARIVGFLLGAWIFISGIRGLGADVVPLLAGLGVGGLAVALAAQRTLANFIGSLIIFANKPVRVGDFCRYGDQIGSVEQIGLISTRIRSLERTIVTVPNAEFSEMKLENFAKRDERLFKTVLQLRYETTPDQMRYVLANLRELFLGHPMVTPDPARVRFIGFSAYSKDVEVFSYLRCQDQNTFLAAREDLLLRMEDIVIDAGTGFAFPSQTAYLARDTGLDKARKEEAETQVEYWRAKDKLPFPEFEEEDRERLEDILDYPPQGSPDYKPHAE